MRNLAKSLAAILLLILPVHAQEAPGAGLSVTPPREVLESIYYVVAVLKFCDIKLDDVRGERLARIGYGLEKSLGMTLDDSYEAFDRVAQEFIGFPPDCTDVKGIESLLGAP